MHCASLKKVIILRNNVILNHYDIDNLLYIFLITSTLLIWGISNEKFQKGVR